MGDGFIDRIKAIAFQPPVKREPIVSQPSRAIELADFEKQLFRGGVLIFDPATDQTEISDDLAISKTWFNEHPTWREKGVLGLMEEGSYNYSWRQFFSGQIPARWKDWREAYDDFNKAGELGIQLSKTLVDAGVSHTLHHTVEAAGKSQKLDLDQLTMVIANPNMPGWGIDEVIKAQREKGISEGMIEKARIRAQEVLKKREEGRRKRIRVSKTDSPRLNGG